MLKLRPNTITFNSGSYIPFACVRWFNCLKTGVSGCIIALDSGDKTLLDDVVACFFTATLYKDKISGSCFG